MFLNGHVIRGKNVNYNVQCFETADNNYVIRDKTSKNYKHSISKKRQIYKLLIDLTRIIEKVM